MKHYTEKQSFGVLLFTGKDYDRKYLLIQNRDSEAFIYFFLSWNMNRWTDQYLCKVIRGFSKDELNRLLYYPFDLLYTDLYVNHQRGTFQKQYDRAKSNYDYFHSRKDWVVLAQNCPTTEIKWGFPKGRIEPTESPFECALRELREEVDIHQDQIKFQEDQSPVSYLNEKSLFRTIVHVTLFPAECLSPISFCYKHFENTIRCKSISNEVLHACWFSIEEALTLLPQHLSRVLYDFHLRKIETEN